MKFLGNEVNPRSARSGPEPGIWVPESGILGFWDSGNPEIWRPGVGSGDPLGGVQRGRKVTKTTFFGQKVTKTALFESTAALLSMKNAVFTHKT